jgi:hypothetical protein
MPDFTLRNVAKYAVTAVIHGTVAKHTETAITDHTRFEEDDMIVDIAAHVTGWCVSHKLKPHTDKIVDKTADFVVKKREARKAKKQEKTPTETE